MDNSSRQKAILDRVAVGLSGLCLLHCLLLPFVVAFLPFLGQFGNDHFHAELLFFVVPVSVIALGVGYRRHRRAAVLVFGATGLLILAVGGTYVHDTYGDTADRAMTVAGSIVLALTHFKNFRLARKDLLLISQ